MMKQLYSMILIISVFSLHGCVSNGKMKPLDFQEESRIDKNIATIVSWNVAKKNDFIRLLEDDQSPDILCLQEISFDLINNDEYKNIIKNHFQKGHFAPSWTSIIDREGKKYNGVATLSKLSVEGAKDFLSPNKEFFSLPLKQDSLAK